MRSVQFSIVCFIAVAAALWAASGARAQPSDSIEAGYRVVYDGRPEEARSQFDRLREGRASLPPWFGSLFATIHALDYDEALTTDFERSLDRFIEEASNRHARSEHDVEALFYLAQGLLLRSTYRVTHDKGMWGAARDAARSKRLTEQYLEQHPEHGDAYAALGLYNYFVGIAPNYVKVLRVLLFLPPGNREQGLAQLQRAAKDGNFLAPFTQTALAEIYSSFEGRPRDAIPLAEAYLRRYPNSAEVRLNLASMFMDPRLEQFAAAENTFNAVLATAMGDTPRHISHRYSALAGLAGLRRAQWRLEEAIDMLDTAIAENPAKPRWIVPALLVRRGNYKMLVNDPSAQRDADRVLADPEMKRWHRPARQLLTSIETRRRNNEGPVYAALIPGNRLVAADRFDEARRAYADVAARHPSDWQVRYRLAYLEFAKGDFESAATALQVIVGASAQMPDWIKANALLYLAYTHDLAGRRDQAIKLYRRIVDKYNEEGVAGLARSGLVAPYQGPS
jgi:tetratricopeptide (TPR) repeat protein